MSDHRLKTAYQFVLALGARIKTLQAVCDGIVQTLIETGFELQPVKLGQTAPLATIKTVAT